MDEARQLAERFPEHDYLVAIAQTQSAGRGRHNRHWVSDSDGLWMTALLRPSVPARYAPWFTLTSAVAVAEVLQESGYPVGIKWPNDVLVTEGPFARRKVSGIRCEMQLQGDQLAWVSAGIGINIRQTSFPDDLAQKAASLWQINEVPITHSEVAGALLDKLEQWFGVIQAGNLERVRDCWRALALGVGETVSVHEGEHRVTGIMRGIDQEGRLMLESDDGSLHIVPTGDLVFEV